MYDNAYSCYKRAHSFKLYNIMRKKKHNKHTYVCSMHRTSLKYAYTVNFKGSNFLN